MPDDTRRIVREELERDRAITVVRHEIHVTPNAKLPVRLLRKRGGVLEPIPSGSLDIAKLGAMTEEDIQRFKAEDGYAGHEPTSPVYVSLPPHRPQDRFLRSYFTA